MGERPPAGGLFYRPPLAGRYAVTVRANRRITFAWDGQDAIEVDYEDYH
jgi:plasmid maintenance system killer protein